jgi:hypothetical protein
MLPDSDLMLNLFWFAESVAQLVEHVTFNDVVAGSSPARLTIPIPAHID